MGNEARRKDQQTGKLGVERIRLAKKFVHAFQLHLVEKSEQIYKPIQYKG